jgi:hypothetical protein
MCRFNSCPMHCNGSFVYRPRTPASHAGRAGSIPARATDAGQVVESADTQVSEACARQGLGVQVSPWSLDAEWTGAVPAGSHKPSHVGSNPTSATSTAGYANRQSDQVESLMFVGSTPTSVTVGRLSVTVAPHPEDVKDTVQFREAALGGTTSPFGPVVQRRRRLDHTQESDGSTPSGITALGLSSKGRTPAWHAGNPGSTPGGSTDTLLRSSIGRAGGS